MILEDCAREAREFAAAATPTTADEIGFGPHPG